MTYMRTKPSANLSEADREKEISLIKRENANILQNLTVLEGEERALVNSKTQQIKQLARNYERLAELGEYKEPINHICASIVNLCTEPPRKLFASAQLARMALEDKYKQTQYTSHNNLPTAETYTTTDTLPSPVIEPTIDNTVFDTEVPREEPNNITNQYFGYSYESAMHAAKDDEESEFEINKPLTSMTRDELRQVAEGRRAKTRKSREALLEDRRREKEALEECEKRKIPLSPEFEQLPVDHISAKSPDSGPSPAWYKAIELYKAYGKLCDKLYRWRPPKHIQEAMVEAFQADIEFLEPFLDEKYRKCQPQWWVVQLKNLWHGKHGAAIMNSTVIDDNLKRALTREQVGDRGGQLCHICEKKAGVDYARAIRFSLGNKKWAALWQWFVEMNEKGIAKRAVELGPTLSDKAFS